MWFSRVDKAPRALNVLYCVNGRVQEGSPLRTLPAPKSYLIYRRALVVCAKLSAPTIVSFIVLCSALSAVVCFYMFVYGFSFSVTVSVNPFSGASLAELITAPGVGISGVAWQGRPSCVAVAGFNQSLGIVSPT